MGPTLVSGCACHQLVDDFLAVGGRALRVVRDFLVVQMCTVHLRFDLVTQQGLAGVEAKSIIAQELCTLHHLLAGGFGLMAICQAGAAWEALEAHRAITAFISAFTDALTAATSRRVLGAALSQVCPGNNSSDAEYQETRNHGHR